MFYSILVYLLCTFLTLIVSITLYFVIKWLIIFVKFERLHIPGPKSLPLLGNLLAIPKDTFGLIKLLESYSQRYGGVVRLYLIPGTVTILLSSPKYVNQVLMSKANIGKTGNYEFFKDFMHEGLATASSNVWKKHRKLYSHLFNTKSMEYFNETFNRAGTLLIKTLLDDAAASEEHQQAEDSKRIRNHLQMTLLKVATECLFGVPFEIVDIAKHVQYAENMNNLFTATRDRVSSIYRFDCLFKLSADYKRTRRMLHEVHQYADDIIQRKMAAAANASANGKETTESILDILLELHQHGQLSYFEIMSELHTFMFAGHDTTWVTILFALYALSKHPEMQEQLYNELLHVCTDNDKDNTTINELGQLKYMDYVLKEVMRLYPAVPYMERNLGEDLVTDEYGVIPKGTDVIISPYILQNSEDNFENCKLFDPNRFWDENQNGRKHNSDAYLPFALGPRNCIGQRFGILELKSVLARIIRHFKIQSTNMDYELELTSHAVLSFHNELPIKLQKRQIL